MQIGNCLFAGGRMYKSKGFTLIELVIVIAVMSVIAMMAVPSFQSMIYDYELKKEFKELGYVLGDGKTTSRVSNQSVPIYFREPETGDPDQSLYLHVNEAKYDFNMNGEEILFRNNGVIDPAAGDFPLCFELTHIKSGQTKKIELSQLGMQQASNGACGEVEP